jgi:hypothetical protein
MQFLPCITTTAGSSWESKINDAKELQIDEVAVFPTCLDVEERKKLYFALEKSYIKKIPFVHLRNDSELWEVEYFIKKFNTSIFNIHSVHQNGEINPELIKFKNIICVENHHVFDDEELSKWGGICLDFAHMENEIMLNEKKEAEFLSVIQKHPIRCGHISVIKNAFKVSETGEISYDSHSLSDLSELDYLRRYPVAYFDSCCAIELENGLEKQLEVIEYIKKLLSFRDELIKKIF